MVHVYKISKYYLSHIEKIVLGFQGCSGAEGFYLLYAFLIYGQLHPTLAQFGLDAVFLLQTNNF